MTYASTVLADSPAAYWKLNETSGTSIADSSGNGHSGLWTPGSGLLNQAGPVAGVPSVKFDGSVSKIAATAYNPSFASAFSWELWYTENGGTVGGGARMFSSDHTDNTYTGWDVLMAAGTTCTFNCSDQPVVNATWATVSGTVPKTAGFHHLVGTFDGQTTIIYLDGPQLATATDALGTGGMRTPIATAITMGTAAAYSGDFWAGFLSNVAVYATILSSTQVAAHYAAMFAPAVTPAPPPQVHVFNQAAVQRAANW